ncbi:MAG: hypothetical protein LUH42_06000, partial [Oscillospiraceae bacterium]|nr:hypothetical protein [Oscillospiraceae bacterium]
MVVLGVWVVINYAKWGIESKYHKKTNQKWRTKPTQHPQKPPKGGDTMENRTSYDQRISNAGAQEVP